MRTIILLGMIIAIALSANAQKNNLQDELIIQLKVLELEKEITKKQIQRDSLLMIIRNQKLTENQATVKAHPIWINTENIDEIENELFFDFHNSLQYIIVIIWKEGKMISKETVKNGKSIKLKGNVQVEVLSPTGTPIEVNSTPFLF